MAGLAGLSLYLALMQRPYGLAICRKAAGFGVDCPWPKLLAVPWTDNRFHEISREVADRVNRVETSPDGLERYSTPGRDFWIPAGSRTGWDARRTLTWMLTEQRWLNELAPEHTVRKGEVVVDVGAHVGTFGDDALARGASQVIMIEVAPDNAECIRRNFAGEIAAGRVVLIAEGAWCEKGALEFHTGVGNSGTGSLLRKEPGARSIRVPVRPIDHMLKERGIRKVDVLKMDIEGAERQALLGAGEVLRTHRPRVMLDAYHKDDDQTALPAILRAAHPGYRMYCPACTTGNLSDGKAAPYALVFY